MQDRVITGIAAGRRRSALMPAPRRTRRREAVVLLNRAVGVCCHQQTADFMSASVAASPFRTVRIVGLGRAGTAIAARLRERGALADSDASVVLLCVPDAVIADVAATVRPGPWVAHVSGATPLQALHPHQRRFSVHPLQTLVRGRGPEQLDGAYAAVTAESEDARAHGYALADLLGLTPFDLADDERALYHAAATLASNYLVTLHRAAAALFAEAGAPQEALMPLIRRTIDNGFELTGPISRGDSSTIAAHVRALQARRPELERLYRALAEATVT
jgi:predicted short-subunit dehydrogenase-like oxidoreductase (DUF2520 family)